MNTKHTPGPWQVHGSHVYSADPARALLAQVFNPGSKASDYPLDANATLIAAAPDLLAALVSIRNQLSSGNAVASDISHAVEIARAAIEKAEGRQ